MAAPFPPVRRLVTGHTPDGKAVFESDMNLEPVDPLAEDGKPTKDSMFSFSLIHRTQNFPAEVQGKPTEYHGVNIPLAHTTGVTCRFVDFPPLTPESKEEGLMHRTVSLDFGVIISGSITLVLDDGVEKKMNQGDVVVQR